ncbi:family 2 glycosyl transferase, partial [Streptomyces prasinopilosus]|uniref:family 2 glycosyl transferase n=1 Tax=Streptomyces prasinopilosus TaxID=67344 RepID=UPI000AD77697
QQPGLDERAGGEVGADAGQRHRTDEQDGHGEPGRAEQQGGQGRHEGEVGRCGAGAAGAHRVPGVRVPRPQLAGPGGDDADFIEVEQFARLKRIARKPGPVLFLLLLLVSLTACRALLGGGALAGGALLPAPADSGELWARYTDTWHAVGAGGTGSAPPYLALVASLATLLLGSTGLAVTVLLVGSVPLAGISAYFASRPLVESRLLRAWAAIAYAFLPAITGALAGGRIGTAVLAVLLPLIARAGIAASGLAHGPGVRGSWRATWAYALLLTLATAFTPVVWPVALVLGLGVLALRRADLPAYGLRFLAQLGTPLLVLAPWSLSLLPFGFFREAGLEYGASAASALDLLGASPGGPGAAGGTLFLGIVLAALAALLRSERRLAIGAAWAAALVGLVFAVLSNGSAWAGPATLVHGIALLAAAVLGADGARSRVAEQNFGWRQPVAVLIALACAAGPLLAAAGWMLRGADGPLARRDPVQVPAFVAEESGTRDQARTLVLDSDSAARVDYVLVRGSGARMGDAEITASAEVNTGLGKVVANLVAGSGADQADQLGGFAVRYVLVHPGAPRDVTRVLDATPGLTRLSQQAGGALWRVDQNVARATVVPAKGGEGEPQAVAAGPVEIDTEIPDGAEGRVLRLADAAAEGWTATLDGKPLTRTTVDGWAQGFRLPAAGGRLAVTYEEPFTHTAWLWAQGLLAVVLVVLALPGRRRDVDDDLPEEPAVPAEALAGDGRRARRLRAQAEAEAAAAEETGTDRDADGDAADGTDGGAHDGFDAPPQPAAVPQQRPYDEWDASSHPDPQPHPNPGYDGAYTAAAPYPQGQQQPPADGYGQHYPTDPYQGGQDGGGGRYDPYAYDGTPPQPQYDPTAYGRGYEGYDGYDQTYAQGYDASYDPEQPHRPQPGSERPDGSQQ